MATDPLGGGGLPPFPSLLLVVLLLPLLFFFFFLDRPKPASQSPLLLAPVVLLEAAQHLAEPRRVRVPRRDHLILAEGAAARTTVEAMTRTTRKKKKM